MRSRAKNVLPPLALFAINAVVCRRLLSIEYLGSRESIEGLYIGLVRHVARNWPDLWWWPLWYGGIPFQNTSPPLVPFAAAAISAALHVSPGFAFHAAGAFFYCLGPVCLYWLALRLSGSRAYGFWAALAWSLLSPSAWVVPKLAEQIGGPWNAQRLHTLASYGDAGHVAALGLVPAAIACLDVALSRRKPLYYLLAALSMTAVMLADWVGLAGLAAALVCYLLAGAPPAGGQAEGRGPSKSSAIRRALGIVLLGYLVASPWLPPSTIRTFQFNSQTLEGDYRGAWGTLLEFLPAIVAGLAGLKLLFSRLRVSRLAQFSVFLLFLTAGITLMSEWAHIALVARPGRYHLEMEFAACLAGTVLARALLRRAPPWSKALAAGALLVLAFAQVGRYRAYAGRVLEPVNMKQRVEYRAATWFDEHLRGQRVMASGSVSYWLNAFTDTPQLSGLEQGATDWMSRVAIYALHTGENAGGHDARNSVLWLKAFGIHAVQVSGDDSETRYRPYRNPRKFEGVLEALWHDGGDTVYGVPARSLSLAHAVLREDLASRAPAHGLDVEPLQRYVTALENPARPLAPLTWRGNRKAQIVATLKPEHLLSVQVSYHPGWHATVNNEPRRVFSDGLGLLAIEPNCAGTCLVELHYDGGLEMKMARFAGWAAVPGMLLWIVLFNRKKARQQAKGSGDAATAL